MAYTVYKHTSPSGKVYIGITSQKPEKRWGLNGAGYKHSPHLMAAIGVYGWDAFKHEILAEGINQEEAERMETALIAEYDSTNREKGYNTDIGGSTGAKHSDETRQKIGDANRGRVWSEESKQKLRAYKLAHPTAPETARKIGDANRGRKHRRESIEKIRAAQKKSPVKNLTTGEKYASVMEAARICGLDPSKIVKVCKGKRKSHGGYRWAYGEVIA